MKKQESTIMEKYESLWICVETRAKAGDREGENKNQSPGAGDDAKERIRKIEHQLQQILSKEEDDERSRIMKLTGFNDDDEEEAEQWIKEYLQKEQCKNPIDAYPKGPFKNMFFVKYDTK